MSGKKIAFGRPKARSADEWVTAPRPQDGTETSAASGSTREPMKRLTIDIPRDLHSRVKAACALRGVKMADEIRLLLEREFSSP